jgi:hypothetical protein
MLIQSQKRPQCTVGGHYTPKLYANPIQKERVQHRASRNSVAKQQRGAACHGQPCACTVHDRDPEPSHCARLPVPRHASHVQAPVPLQTGHGRQPSLLQYKVSPMVMAPVPWHHEHSRSLLPRQHSQTSGLPRCRATRGERALGRVSGGSGGGGRAQTDAIRSSMGVTNTRSLTAETFQSKSRCLACRWALPGWWAFATVSNSRLRASPASSAESLSCEELADTIRQRRGRRACRCWIAGRAEITYDVVAWPALILGTQVD